MEHRVMVEKGVSGVKDNEHNFCREVLKEQNAMSWDALIRGGEICLKVGLPNCCEQFLHQEQVKEAVLYHHQKVMKEEKLEDIRNEDF